MLRITGFTMKTVSDHFSLLYETTPTANITELKLIPSTMSAYKIKSVQP